MIIVCLALYNNLLVYSVWVQMSINVIVWSAAEQAGLSLTWSHTPEDRSFHVMAHFRWHKSPLDKMSHVMRKPVYAICEKQRSRSACASAQSDQRLCCSLLG